MKVERIELSTAQTFVKAWHRHSGSVPGHLFSLGLFGDDFALHGVAITGRPVSKVLQQRGYAEVSRLCTDGTRNACSMLYAAACREARKRGYLQVCTYTLASETGASLRASGFRLVAKVRGREWTTPTRERPLRGTNPNRVRWERAS